jgi:hypothetical protein
MGDGFVAYTMVAKLENQKVRKQRNSALIVMASARVWESEGWEVTITDAEGKEFDLAGFEEALTRASSWLQARHVPAPDVQAEQPVTAVAEHAESDEEYSEEGYSEEEYSEAHEEYSEIHEEYAEADAEHAEPSVEPA